MTLGQFAEATAERIPTPAEFLAFARGQGWSIKKKADGTAALSGHNIREIPLAVKMARMLGREPYRTNVLKELDNPENSVPAETVFPQKPPVPTCESSMPGATVVKTDSPTTSTHSLTTCSVCLSDVNEAEMRALPKGMWMEMCGRSMGQRSGEPCCPYHPKSLWSNPPS